MIFLWRPRFLGVNRDMSILLTSLALFVLTGFLRK